MVKLLLIEDDILISQMYQDVFTFHNYTVIIADNGEEGVALAKKEQPTMILCDVMMPKMNGLEVLDALKSDPQTSAIPVVMLTNLSGEEDAKNALMKGAIKYLVKSKYAPKEVATIVKELIAGYTRDQVPETTTS